MASESPTRTSGFLGFLAVTAVLGAGLILSIAFLALSGSDSQTLEQRRAANRTDVRSRLEKEAQEKLNSEGWVDKAKGLVHVSIADAIPLAVVELRSKKPAPSQVKVEPPLLPVVLPPDSKEPPPPLLPSAPQGADTIRFVLPGTPETSAPAAPVPAAPAPAAAPAVPAPAPPAAPPAPAPTPPPAPAAAPAPVTVPPVPAPPTSAPAAPVAAPVPQEKSAPAPAPARPPLINPTENPAPTK